MRLCRDGQCLDGSNTCRAYDTGVAHPSMTLATLKSALDSNYVLSQSCSFDAVTQKVQHQTLYLCDRNSCLSTDSNHNPTFCKRMSDKHQVAPQVVETTSATQLSALLGMGYHNLPCSFCELPEAKAPPTPAPKCPNATPKPTAAPKCPNATPKPTATPRTTPPPTPVAPVPTSKPSQAPPPTPIPTPPVSTPTPTPNTPNTLPAQFTMPPGLLLGPVSCSSDPRDASTPVLSSTPVRSGFPIMCPTPQPTKVVAETCGDFTCATFPPQPKPKLSCDE